ncbi:hypothetical protein [Bradyrhizobium genosp. P]
MANERFVTAHRFDMQHGPSDLCPVGVGGFRIKKSPAGHQMLRTMCSEH